MRKILTFLLFVLPTLLSAQTTVNLSVTDTPDNQTWNNGTWKVNVQFPPGSNQTGPFFVISGGGSVATQSGALSGTGTASFNIPANINIAPGGTQWLFTVCPQATPSGCFTQFVTVSTSSPQTVALTPPSIRINLSVAVPPISAYSTTEVTGAALGSQFFLIGTGQQVCQTVVGNGCTVWASLGGGLPSGGTVGQVVVNTAPGSGSWQDPNVSFAPVNLFNAVTANATHTSANVKNPVYSQSGSLLLTFASLSGVYTGCTIQLEAVDSLGNVINSGSAIAVTPVNGTSSLVAPVSVATNPTAPSAFIAAVWNCSAFGSAGTLSLDFAGQISGPGQGTGATSIGQWVQPGQALLVQMTAMNGTAVTAVDLIVDAKILLQNGQIQTTRYEINPCNFSGNIAMSGFAITQGGWLQTFVEDINTGGIPQGDVLLNLYIANSIGAADTVACHTSLAASQIGTSLGTWMTGSFLPTGFIGTTGNITHPWSIPGLQAVKTQSNPAAGNDFSFQLSGPAINGRACITGVNFFLTANATVATRTVALRIVQLANGLGSVGLQPDMFFISPVDQTAGQLVFYSFAPAVIPQQRTMFGNGGDIPFVTIPFASGQICADAGMIISVASRIHGLQAGDQISGVYVWVTQWHDND